MYINADCFEYLKTIETESIDCVIADPPYGINFSGVTSNTSWDNINDYEEYISNFLIEIKRVLKPNGICWLFCARTQFIIVNNAVTKIGLLNNLKYWLTWARNKGRGSKNVPKSIAEEILCISKSKDFYYENIQYLRDVVIPYVKDGKPRGWFVDQNTGSRVRWTGLGNVLCFSSPFHNNRFEKQIHSTQKPFLLICELLLLTTKPNDVILDPFMGSGVSGIACDVLGRKFIGIEKDIDMYKKATNWFNTYDKKLVNEYIANRLDFPYKIDLFGDNEV